MNREYSTGHNFVWSAREKVTGGPVVPVRSHDPMPAVSRVVVLVHGYNNTQRAARASYDAFLANAAGAAVGTFWPVAEFYWPGDKPWGPFSGLSYPLEIKSAQDAAHELCVFLRTLLGPGGAPVEVAFVSHSLGGRLLLELLDEARQAGPRLIVPAVCMMAPAVPIRRVDAGGVLRAAAEVARRAIVFHSEHDTVLKWAFRLGQFAAGEGFFSRAVGRFGEPRIGLWAASIETSHNHGDYWSAADCADEVSRQLGAAPDRRILTRARLAHETPVNNDPGARTLGN